MEADNLSAEDAVRPGGSNRDARAFAHLRDVFAEAARPYVEASLAVEHEGYAYDERGDVLYLRDALLHGFDHEDNGFGDEDGYGDEPFFGESEGGPWAEEREPPPTPVTEKEIIRATMAVATALAHQWVEAVTESVSENGDLALQEDLLPDNFDPEPLYMYAIDPESDLGPIMLNVTELLFDQADRIELPMGLQMEKDQKSGNYVVTPAPGPG